MGRLMIPLLLIIMTAAQGVNANPFLGESGKSRPAPAPVMGRGIGPFIDMQFEYRDRLASLLREMKKGGKASMLMIFIGASFLYGLFHAAGPGHRKTIVFSLFLSKKTKWHEPLAAGFLSAGIHAGMSVIIISILWLLHRSVVSLSSADLAYRYMEGSTFLLLFVFALALIVFRLYAIARGKEDKSDGTIGNGIYPLIIVSSFIPCPGAMMLLILSMYLELVYVGVAGVFAMSVGMGIVISASGYLAFAGRKGLFLRLKRKERLLKGLTATLEITSYFIILLFALFMMLPFVCSMAS